MAYGKKGMVPLVKQLEGVVSESMIEQCRWLAKHWEEREVKAADRRNLALHMAFKLTFFLSEARKQAVAGKLRMENRCRAAFDGLLQLKSLKVSDIEDVKRKLLADLRPGSAKRRITEGRDGIILALNKIRRRIESDSVLMANSPKVLLRDLNALEKNVAAWYELPAK